MDELTDERMINEFVSESREHLETIEPDLLALEQDGAQVSLEVINRVFRAMHSIKGTSGFFGFEALMQLSHAMENVFMKFRDGEMLPDPEKIDALLAGADKIRKMIEDVDSSDSVSYEQELAKINAFLDGDKDASLSECENEANPNSVSGGKSGAVVECLPNNVFNIVVKGPSGFKDAVFELSKERLSAARANGWFNLYALWVHFKQDLVEKGRTSQQFISRLQRLGQCFYENLDGSAFANSGNLFKEDSVFHIFLGTVLEPDLMGYALNLPERQIKVLKKGDLDPAKAIPKQGMAEEKAHEPPPKHMPAEKVPEESRSGTSETIRVRVDLLDRLMNRAGELVLGRNQLRRELETLAFKIPKLGIAMQNVDSVTSKIQQDIMQIRMQPMGNLFNKISRLVRDLSRRLSKEVALFIEGEQVESDKTILEGLSDPLTHLIRNCMDHGIELPDERERAGKPRSGKIYVKAFHEGGQVNIVVTDDGRGIDPDKLVQKAIKNGSIDPVEAKRMNAAEKINLILLPGLSTAEKVTGISGRGVGMDVVKINIERLGGNLEIESTVGTGTRIRIRLPLTLAIIPSLTVGAAGLQFAIPQVSIKELVCIRSGDVGRRVEEFKDAEVLRLREILLPLIRLTDVLGLKRTFVHPETEKQMPDQRQRLADRRQQCFESNCNAQAVDTKRLHQRCNVANRRQNRISDINVVVLRVGINFFGLVVDELFNNEEIVVKPLSKYVKASECFAGATIMGDGRVAMILDASGIAEFSQLRFADINAEERRRQEEEARRRKTSGAKPASILTFNNAYNEYFALPLESISRLEKIFSKDIHKVGAHLFMNYLGNGLRLIYLEDILPVCPFPGDLEEFFVIIPKANDFQAGIIVSRILDTVETNVSIQKANGALRGILGSAFVEEHLIQLVDPVEVLQLIKEKLLVN